MDLTLRDQVIRQLRRPGSPADMLIEDQLGLPRGGDTCPPYTGDVDIALSLIPRGVHFLCGRFEGSALFWCDVGFRPQVQAWGENLAAAIAGAAFAYRTHPDLARYGHTGRRAYSVWH